MTGQVGGALAITLLSAIALNWGYLREHEAARDLPPLSVRRPRQTALLLRRCRPERLAAYASSPSRRS